VLGNPDLAVVRGATTNADFLGPLLTAGAGPQPAWPGVAGPTPYRALPSPYLPAHGPYGGPLPQGFLLLGPPEAVPPDPVAAYGPFRAPNSARIPGPTPVLRTPGLQYFQTFRIRQQDDPPDERKEGVAVLLRRLANPYLPFDGRRNIGAAPNFTFNPYVTVDYLEDVPVQPVQVGVSPPLVSRGRLQPYARHRGLLQAQTAQTAPTLRSSFGRENVPAPARYDWLTHLDRPLRSPMELLQVSGCQPYQLTQRFMSPDATGQLTRFNHRAPWLDE